MPAEPDCWLHLARQVGPERCASPGEDASVVDAVDPKFTELVGVYRTQDDTSTRGETEASCGGCTSVAMNSEAYDEWVGTSSRVPWTSVAGKPWFMRSSATDGPSGDYTAGCWLSQVRFSRLWTP